MGRTATIAAVAAAALLGAGAGAAAVAAYDDNAGRHPMMSGAGPAGALSGRTDGPADRDPDPGRAGRGGAWMMGNPMAGAWMMGGWMMGGGHVAAADEPEFLAEMIAHHEEAIRAARELGRSDREEMRDFGERIVADQSAQVELMRGWLEQWHPEQPTDTDYEPMMRDLTGLSGDRLDRTFLEDMVGHHMAAVMASQHLLVAGLAEHDEVAELAADIRDAQHAEIVQMRRWLLEWFGTGGVRGMPWWTQPE